MSRLLILDKNILQGTPLKKLLEFVQYHEVILPHVLCVECTISQVGNSRKASRDPIRLLEKLVKVVTHGAYVGKSPGKIIEEERVRNAAIESLVDMEVTQFMRKGSLDPQADLNAARKECEEAFKPIIESVKKWSKQYYENICKRELETDFRAEVDKSRLVVRLKKWVSSVDNSKDDILKKFFPQGDELAGNRWQWQLIRLSLAWGIELASRRNKSGPSSIKYNTMSNDIFDIHYVSHLSQTVGLVSSDKKLVQPLAMAAFPHKEVFSNIDDVPQRYSNQI